MDAGDTCGCKKYDPAADVVPLWTAGNWRTICVKTDFVWKVKNKAYQLTYVHWYPQEPNNIGGNEACIEIMSSRRYRWNDASCKNKICFLCQMTV